MKITGLAASTSSTSINKQLVQYVLTHYFNDEVYTLLDLNDYEMPLFSVDRELQNGYPEAAHRFLEDLGSADLLVISMAEHNGNYTAAFKNTFDWASRVNAQVFQDKPLLLLSTSTGGYGAKNSLNAAITRFPKHGANILATFSLPSFNDNFSAENGILSEELSQELENAVELVKSTIAKV